MDSRLPPLESGRFDLDTMASGGVRIHPSDDMGSYNIETVMSSSHMSELDRYSQLPESKASSNSKSLTLEEAFLAGRRKKLGYWGRGGHKEERTEDNEEFQRVCIILVSSCL